MGVLGCVSGEFRLSARHSSWSPQFPTADLISYFIPPVLWFPYERLQPRIHCTLNKTSVLKLFIYILFLLYL